MPPRAEKRWRSSELQRQLETCFSATVSVTPWPFYFANILSLSPVGPRRSSGGNFP